jgi:hypothetical protein
VCPFSHNNLSRWLLLYYSLCGDQGWHLLPQHGLLLLWLWLG